MRPSASRPWILRSLAAALVVICLLGATTATMGYAPTQLKPGTVTSPANGSTIVAVQGFHFQGEGNRKKPARLVSAGPQANIQWIYNGSQVGANWFYDADPLDNGNILAVNTIREGGVGKTLVYELDPNSDPMERVWEQKFNLTDTHDVDLINGDQLLVAAMREGVDDRLFIYDLGEDEVVWEWYFRNHYPNSTDGGVPANGDWTHVNDVDKVGEGKYMASPRNFDQVIVVDRETKDITLRLGEDQNYDILFEQHNPTYLETEDGRPVILVGDSENNRVVEYTCQARVDGDCNWEQTWVVGVDGKLNWPRDANRLPNGNTLITDSRNHRVIEVTPRGEIVWEAYVPWAPFSAERVAYGNDGVRSPTMTDLGVSGAYGISGSAGLTPGTGDDVTFPDWLRATFGDVPVIGGVAESLAFNWQRVALYVRPVWMAPWSLVGITFAVLLLLIWGVGEAVYQRRRISAGVRQLSARVRG